MEPEGLNDITEDSVSPLSNLSFICVSASSIITSTWLLISSISLPIFYTSISDSAMFSNINVSFNLFSNFSIIMNSDFILLIYRSIVFLLVLPEDMS